MPTPAEAVEGGAEPAAVEAAQTDTPMPEEDAYANFSGEGHDGDKEFGAANTTRGRTSRSLVDAMRGYEGKDMGELEAAMRAVPTKRGGKRRLSPYQRRMMQQHAKRRGFGPDMSPAPTLTGGGDEDPGASAPDEPSTPDEPPAPTLTEKKPKEPMMPTQMEFSEDPIDSAWNALMILKHR